MLFQNGAHFHEFRERLWHRGLELADWLWRADTGDHVFALGVDEELTVEFVHSIRWVAGECHAGTGGFARVTVDHGLHVNGCAPCGGDVIFAAINDRAVVHP